MKRYLFLLLVAMSIMTTAVAQAQVKKYDIKSGVITYESINSFGIKMKIVVSFDDYGMRECRDTYLGDKLKESFFSDGKNLYRVNHMEKTAYNIGPAYRGTELRVEWTEFGTEADRKSGKYKKLPPRKIADKNCEMFEYNDGKGTITQYGGWNKILLYMDVKMKDMETIQRALKVEENVKVPAEKFEIPNGYKIEKQ